LRNKSQSAAGIALLIGVAFGLSSAPWSRAAEVPVCFEVTANPQALSNVTNGRLFVILAKTNQPEPRLTLTRAGADAPQSFAWDLKGLGAGSTLVLAENGFGFPCRRPADFFTNRSATYTLQAIFDFNPDLRSANGPGNLFSRPQLFRWSAPGPETVKIELTEQIPPEKLPAETDYLKFVKIQSKLLTQFHGHPVFLRAGIVLPRDFEREPARRYPLWIRIGGLNARYSATQNLMASKSDFRKSWLANETPRFILLQLDGAGPLGDPYQVNSANSGPYGDALVQELIPYVEEKFRGRGEARGRVLSGTSTGGWVCLALKIFYPDFFNGAWASCPDPVDFRALEVLDIYGETNAYVDQQGNERPSERDGYGRVVLTMRREVGAENYLGWGNSYTLSGQQWGAWNATFGPRGRDRLPLPLWDPQTGEMNADVARQWEKYDLRLVLERNWSTLGPKLRGKLHIASGEADQYYLNKAVHLLEQSLAKLSPPAEARIVYGPGKLHGWSNLSPVQMLKEMQAACERP
jgi:S-formylglutathione hydrolase FrmB